MCGKSLSLCVVCADGIRSLRDDAIRTDHQQDMQPKKIGPSVPSEAAEVPAHKSGSFCSHARLTITVPGSKTRPSLRISPSSNNSIFLLLTLVYKTSRITPYHSSIYQQTAFLLEWHEGASHKSEWHACTTCVCWSRSVTPDKE